jgi:GGDEF domain-containing protein
VDEVTRLFNRDYFEECLAIEVERAKRYSRNVSLLYLGVTPQSGGMTRLEENVTATQVAEILGLSLRKVDVICRLEPSQYGIILPDTADNTYGIIAKRVFKFFKQVMGENPPVFLNISASTYPKHAGNHLLLMKNAEDLLEQARQVGPNKAVLPE